jgi:hypothetical protein
MIMVQFLQLAAYSGQLRYDAQPIQRPPLPGIYAPGDLVQVVAHSGQLPQKRRIYGRRRRSALRLHSSKALLPHPLRQLGLGADLPQALKLRI